jgi:hypothetical protein
MVQQVVEIPRPNVSSRKNGSAPSNTPSQRTPFRWCCAEVYVWRDSLGVSLFVLMCTFYHAFSQSQRRSAATLTLSREHE